MDQRFADDTLTNVGHSIQPGRLFIDRRPRPSIVRQQYNPEAVTYSYAMPLPTIDTVYAEIPKLRNIGCINKVTYSTYATFCGIDKFECNVNVCSQHQQPQHYDSHRYHLQQNIDINLSNAEDNESSDVLPATTVLVIDYNMKSKSKSCCDIENDENDNDNSECAVYTARVNLVEKFFNFLGTTYTLQMSMESLIDDNKITEDILAATRHELKLDEATKHHHVHAWYIRCFFNDDVDYTFCVSFSNINSNNVVANHRNITTNNSNTDYTMKIECSDVGIQPDEFMVVADLLVKYYKAQHLDQMRYGCEVGALTTMCQTFAAISSIADLTAEQKMLLASMELVDKPSTPQSNTQLLNNRCKSTDLTFTQKIILENV